MRTCLGSLALLASLLTAQTKTGTPSSAAVQSDAARADLILANALGDKNPDVRKSAVSSLGLIGPREPYLSQLSASLTDKDMQVRLAAVASLVDVRDKRTASLLSAALNDNSPEVSFAAAQALWGMGDTRGRDALLVILRGETKTQSGFLTAQKRDMLRMFHTPKTMMIFAVKQGMGFAPVPGLGAGVSSLEGILSAEGGVTGRAHTALLLGTDKSPLALDALKDALNDKDASVRAAVIHSLALRDDRTLAPLLVSQFSDPKEDVRLRAAAGYLRLNSLPTPVVPRHAPASKAPVRPAAAPASKK